MKVDTKTFTTDNQWIVWMRTRYFGKSLNIYAMTAEEKIRYIGDLEARLIEIYKVIDQMGSK